MSTDFKSTKGIFLQIAEHICHRILEGKLNMGERIPSVRDLAAEFEVNRNTVLRTYTLLDESGVFENKRGIGFFVSENAVEIIRQNEREAFFKDDLPEFIHKLRLLQLKEQDLPELMNVLINNQVDEKE